MRVHELAKELDLSSKDLLEMLEELNIEAKSHMTALEEDAVATIRSTIGDTEPTAPSQEKEAATASEDMPEPVAEEAAEESVEDADGEEADEKVITVRGAVIVKEYAEQLGLKPNQLVAELMSMNVFASINERLELKIAQRLAEKHGFVFEHEKKTVEHKTPPKPVEVEPPPVKDSPEDLSFRPPVVTFLGHVDHGKTSLLDKIRSSKVALGEDGGITQHIGAYTVDFQDKKITFIDTPGHAAFTAMRARGANLTDIAVIIIAADAGIMPQTREAIQHAQAANVALMVAINKIDLPAADTTRVMQQLQELNLSPEDWGGETICCPVSAHSGEGIDHLLEMILLQAEMLELKANPDRRAEGHVIEALLEPGMGPTATLLVQKGTLHVGDAVVCGPYWGRVKALINDQGVKVRTAGPSSAVRCLGLTSVPDAGAEFEVYPNDRQAKNISEKRLAEKRQTELGGSPSRSKVSLDDLFAATESIDALELTVILKTDVQGTLEAIQQSLSEIKSDKIRLNVILGGVGNITGNDVLLASASKAIILGFHIGTENGVNNIAKKEGVEIRLYSVIYELLDNVRQAMTGMLEPEFKENVVGHAEVRQVFDISKRGKIAGCMMIDGRVTMKDKARLLRDGGVIFEGTLESLKRFQNDAAEVRDGQECGIGLKNFYDIVEGDVIEFYRLETIAQSL